MSNLVNLESVSKSYGPTLLLDGVSLGLSAGERIGVVGRNGAGKSTLLRVLSKLEEPDAGRVTHAGGLRVGVLAQTDDLDPNMTIRQIVIGDRADHEWAGDARVRSVLTGLFGGLSLPGFSAGLDTVVGPCSGGERRRIALARELMSAPDLLVLDEPTNHLDVEGISWLAGHLAASPQALLVVTHDRWFLDAVCTRTWEVADGEVHAYEGGYAAYVLAKAERERVSAATEAKRGPTGPQGAGLAAPRPARAHDQAPVPHRRRQRADRGRAPRPRPAGAGPVRHRAAGPHRLRTRTT